MLQLPATYSAICTNALLSDIIPLFKIDKPEECLFWCQGLNDTYKVITATQTYILRLYRHNWRTHQAISFELDALLYLQKKGVNVAFPIPTCEGDYIIPFHAPEGLRYAVLTHYIPGKELDFSIPENGALYGKHMAKLHQSSAQFHSSYQRAELNVEHLLTEPLQRIKPFLTKRHDDWLFIEAYAQTLSTRLQQALDKAPTLFFCHGDLHGGNAHINNQQLGFFDFDCCGLGLRSYDLAVFKWSLLTENKSLSIWERFLQSYLKHYPLDTKEQDLIDTLVSIRHIWLIGLHIDIAVAKGWLDESYFDQKIAFLREQSIALNR
ncbi:hypothetical protein GCM10007916_16790 [Psychromonas marina]|uniref:Aminoglycoside phosphotransferase domain-containing protein n=1 Tax=Psychromonas marina TaxID=88364 RepID=A0ABQ6DZV3_9GAMM|nr:phosphotransferase [Psychromonas marina]GLS90612.1 hypothetical protein GCM10007916_16790 [Psychromonas marina]